MVRKGKFVVELTHTPLSRQKKAHLKTLVEELRAKRLAAANPKCKELITKERMAVRGLRATLRQALKEDAPKRFQWTITRTDLDALLKEGERRQKELVPHLSQVPYVSSDAPHVSSNVPLIPAWRVRDILFHFRDRLKSFRANNRRRTDTMEISGRDIWHPEGGFWYKKFRKDKIKREKRPDRNVSKAEYVGIELECYVRNREKVTEDLFPFANHISIVGDGSIHPPMGFQPVEIRVLSKKSELREILLPILAVITNKDNEGGTNNSCGTHVHFDMGRKTTTEVEKCYQNLYYAQSILLAMMPASRRTSTYCQRCQTDRMGEQMKRSRYSLINAAAFEKHGTLEVRLHDGTLDGEELINWIGLIHSIMANETVPTTETKEVDEFGKLYGLSSKELAYVRSRVDRFKHLPEFDAEGKPILTEAILRQVGPEPVWQDGLNRWWCDDWTPSPIDAETWVSRLSQLLGDSYIPWRLRLPSATTGHERACIVGPGCPDCAVGSRIGAPSPLEPRRLALSNQWVDHLGIVTYHTRMAWIRGTDAYRNRPRPTAEVPFPGAIDTWSLPCPINDPERCVQCRIEMTGADILGNRENVSYLPSVSGRWDHRGRSATNLPSSLRTMLNQVGVREIPELGKPLVLTPPAEAELIQLPTETSEEEEARCSECSRLINDCECCGGCGQAVCECCSQCGRLSCRCCFECESYPCECEAETTSEAI